MALHMHHMLQVAFDRVRIRRSAKDANKKLQRQEDYLLTLQTLILSQIIAVF
jgi:hypothetical protein